jgi:hypothetical protein
MKSILNEFAMVAGTIAQGAALYFELKGHTFTALGFQQSATTFWIAAAISKPNSANEQPKA